MSAELVSQVTGVTMALVTLLAGFLLAVVPWLTRRREAFAVTVPESAQADPRIARMRRVYLVVLLAVSFACAAGTYALSLAADPLVLSALACAGIALIMNAVALPLLLKFGAEKARMVSMALFLLVFAGFALLGLAADRGLALPAPPAWVLTALPGLLAILAVGGFALSYCIAQAIYARKEF